MYFYIDSSVNFRDMDMKTYSYLNQYVLDYRVRLVKVCMLQRFTSTTLVNDYRTKPKIISDDMYVSIWTVKRSVEVKNISMSMHLVERCIDYFSASGQTRPINVRKISL